MTMNSLTSDFPLLLESYVRSAVGLSKFLLLRGRQKRECRGILCRLRDQVSLPFWERRPRGTFVKRAVRVELLKIEEDASHQ